MKKTMIRRLLSMMVFFVLGASPAFSEPAPVSTAVKSHNGFAIDLYHTLGQGEGNLFFCPLSISTALSMTCAGAKNLTAHEMQNVLHFEDGQTAFHQGNKALQKLLEKSELIQANSLWPDLNETLLDSFLKSLQKNYGAECNPLDFAKDPDKATAAINKWVEDKTIGRIKNLLQPGDITSYTRLVLANAIVFDGQWQTAFDPNKTVEMPFHLADGSVVKTQGMFQKNHFMTAKLDDFILLEIPFKEEKTSLLIALPDMIGGLPELENSITAKALNGWIPQMRKKEIRVGLPRIEMNERIDLSEVLVRMGMANAFSPKADFSGISAKKGLFIGKVVHQAALKINEEGVEAAAATAVIMKRESATETVLFNRPFIFMIRHRETGSILFMGRIINPGD